MRYSCSACTSRPVLLTLVLLAATCFLLFATCNDDGATKPQQIKPSARLISQSFCKEGLIQPLYAASACEQDCLEYWSDSTGNLHVRHINAGFNCCIDSVAVSVEIRGQVAFVTETEIMQNGCHCLCLYDIEYELIDLPATVTKIEVAEPYANPDQWPSEPPLCCSFNLPLVDTGTCCVERCHYPWGYILSPRISRFSFSGCKSDSVARVDSLAECVEWVTQTGGLRLRHTNAMFNCCLDSLYATISLSGDTVLIIEHEVSPMPCDCLCLNDVDMLIADLTPGTYHFIIRYGPFDEGIPKLEWTVNLQEHPGGKYCNDLCCGPD